MKKILFTLLAACLIPASASWALFTNGGFETGTTAGWTVSGGGNNGPRADVIDNTGTMSYQTTDINPYNGNYMVRIGDVNGWSWDRDWTSISQADAITQADIDDGAKIYVNWGAVLVDPTNTYHSEFDQPFFSINVDVNGINAGHFEAPSSDRLTNPAWSLAGTYYDGSGLWYLNDTWMFDLGSYGVGDIVELTMYVTDCGLSGHGGYAFLDGIGTTYQPPVVPEPSTIALLGAGLVGLVAYRRKKRAAAR